jgi:hypothetical protein
MNEEMIEGVRNCNDREDRVDRLPLCIRNPFQKRIFKILIEQEGLNGNKRLDENDMDEMGRYSKMISDYIDHTKNIEIRNLLLMGDNGPKGAVDLMLEEIDRQDNLLVGKNNELDMPMAA